MDLTPFCSTCPSLGLKKVPLEDSPHHLSLIRVTGGALMMVHSTLLTVTLRKHLSWPSTRGGILVDGDTSLSTAECGEEDRHEGHTRRKAISNLPIVVVFFSIKHSSTQQTTKKHQSVSKRTVPPLMSYKCCLSRQLTKF